MIKLALDEDCGTGDVTAQALIPENHRSIAVIRAKEDLLICGLGVAGAVFSSVDPSLKISQLENDGQYVSKGAPIMEIQGATRAILGAERVALNFLQRLSGISTLTYEYVKTIEGSGVGILDTRKTIPLYRKLEKYAVRKGGGINHRMGLYDELMIKDNHIAACGGNILKAVETARRAYPSKKITLEVVRPDQITSALSGYVDQILLDNMSDDDLRESGARKPLGIKFEASGNMHLGRISSVAAIGGLDYISVGALTHSAVAADLSLNLEG